MKKILSLGVVLAASLFGTAAQATTVNVGGNSFFIFDQQELTNQPDGAVLTSVVNSGRQPVGNIYGEDVINALVQDQSVDLVNLGGYSVDEIDQLFFLPGSRADITVTPGTFNLDSVFDISAIPGFEIAAFVISNFSEFYIYDLTAANTFASTQTLCIGGNCGFLNANGVEEGTLADDRAQLFSGFDDSVLRGITVSVFGRVATAATPAVPEPGTWLLMLMGFGGAALALRRRRSTVLAA